ncbi:MULTISPECIES: hypothetical protein [unclassified Ensifer]|uniref:hypothetical protein n=1 Tax=unclassified Ensifer TaxID=2633371 RepID=UPI0008132D12|nr:MULTISPECIES: hypothetical protein [unclassified Ensifer]OCP17400.1 hypothetical protein BC361_08045 [Ensifer sp. LC54]OCP28694.1 hypothetical protein BC363_02310 [Ensifer sp. LC384]
MTKRRDTLTLDIFRDYQPEEVAARCDPELVKGGTLDVQIARVLSVAMQKSGKTRTEIADEMTEYLGQRVTENMLDGYASPARKDHKITVERFIALLDATECYDLLAFICKQAGFVAVPERYADIIEIWRADREIEELTRQRDARMGRVRGLK